MESVFELLDEQESAGFFDVLAEHRRRPVPEGKRFFAMKERPRARSKRPSTRTCCIIARNRFGVWSQVLQRYVRKTRYLRFTRIGSEVVQLDRICSPLIKQYGTLAWAEYQPWREEMEAMDAVVKKIYFDYAPAWLQRQEETVLSIFHEFVSEGSLVRLHFEKRQLEESTVSAYTRYIKCANILLDPNGIVKVGDFGMAKQIKAWKQKRSGVGRVYWMAPEVIRENPYGRSADVWSLGCTVLEMPIQRPPYPDEDWVSVFYQIGRGQLPPIPSSLSRLARDFIRKSLQSEH